MNKHIALSAALLMMVFSLSACASKPTLKQVSSGAELKPVNSSEQALALQKKYSQ